MRGCDSSTSSDVLQIPQFRLSLNVVCDAVCDKLLVVGRTGRALVRIRGQVNAI